MQFHELMRVAGISDPPQCWREQWPEAERTFPGGFIYPGLADLAASWTRLDDGFVEALRDILSRIAGDDVLLRFAWLWRFCYSEKEADSPSSWPTPDALGECLAGMFAIAVAVTCLPGMLESHNRAGIPEQVTRDTLRDIAIWSEHYHRLHGRWGFAEVKWLRNHLRGRLYRLGRLQFMPITYGGGYRLYRHRDTRRVVAVAESGMRFRRDGLVDGTTGINDPQAWEAVLVEEQEHVRGAAISSDGHATRDTVEIALADWDVLLEKGTKLLDIHIPDGPMDPQSCLESYQMANEFFPRFFPEHNYTGFVCLSWLLDPELAKIQPAESNIVRFQREFYLLPVLSDDRQTWERVFDSRPDDLTAAPRGTSLRRAILDHYLAGNRMSKGYGFIPADEIGKPHDYYGR